MGVSVRKQSPSSEQLAVLSLLKPVRTEHELIRLGGNTDGGYLLPNDLDGIEACFSPGVDIVATFERDLVERNIKTFQIDASVSESPLKHPLNRFERKFLGIETRDDLITLDDWVNANVPPSSGDLILQMDIEGHEWLTLAATSDQTLSRFRIIVLELHFLNLVSEGLSWLFKPVLDKLSKHFDVVHLHANNVVPLEHSRERLMTPYLEVTFHRKDRITQRGEMTQYPHPLDRDNVPEMPSVNLPLKMFS